MFEVQFITGSRIVESETFDTWVEVVDALNDSMWMDDDRNSIEIVKVDN